MASGLTRYMTPDEEMQNPASISMEDLMMLQAPSEGIPAMASEPSIEELMATKGPASIVPVTDSLKQADLAKLYNEEMRKAAIGEDKSAQRLQRYIQDYQAKPRGIDWTAAAAMFDNPRLMQAAQSMKPPSEDEKAQNIMNMQSKLATQLSSVTDSRLKALGQQLSAKQKADQMAVLDKLKKDQMSLAENRQKSLENYRNEYLKIQRAQADAGVQKTKDAREQKQEMGIEKDVQRFEEKAIDATPLAHNLGVVEEILGGKLENFDEKNKTMKGQPIDLPGKSIPLIGRVYEPGSQGESLQSAIATIFNTELKSRSGAAVTDQELDRLRTEFSAGKFNTEEKMVEALKKYKTILRKRMTQHEAAFRPEVLESYKSRGGSTQAEFFGLTNEQKQRRLQELRQKAGQ